MPAITADVDELPSVGEIRAALDHMTASDVFRGSPQLVAFLRYVVEARLRGESDRIKGYTIAVEALGRGPDFDPQTDPIVRVEAMRLRRALGRYHAGADPEHQVQIELPLGSYVPVFSRKPAPDAAPPCEDTAPTPPVADAPPVPAPASRRFLDGAVPVTWRQVLAGAALILIGAVCYAAIDYATDTSTAGVVPLVGSTAGAASDPLRLPAAFPIVFVAPFDSAKAGAERPVAESLQTRLRDALARFDEISVMSGPPPAAAQAGGTAGRTATRYSLSGSVDLADANELSVSVRLTDIADGHIAFVRNFQQPLRGDDAGAAEETIVHQVASAIAQPYGVIHSYERSLQVGSDAGDPRYRCLLESYDYWRSYDPAQHAQARACLERETAADPGFAAGFAALAELTLQEERRNINRRPGDAPPLDRALRAARRAVEARPGSARAYQALMDVHFLRREISLSLAAGEKAVELNPYNPNIVACYGARLIGVGEIEKGMRLLKDAADDIVVRPAWFDFYLFLATYMMNDHEAAASYAALIVSEKSSLTYLARALVAAQSGKANAARRAIDALIELQPAWRDNPRAQLKKAFPADAVATRLAQDLARAGLGVTN